VNRPQRSTKWESAPFPVLTKAAPFWGAAFLLSLTRANRRSKGAKVRRSSHRPAQGRWTAESGALPFWREPFWAACHRDKFGFAWVFFPARMFSTLKYGSISAVSSHPCKKKYSAAKLRGT